MVRASFSLQGTVGPAGELAGLEVAGANVDLDLHGETPPFRFLIAIEITDLPGTTSVAEKV
jgi:hypothetical protein